MQTLTDSTPHMENGAEILKTFVSNQKFIMDNQTFIMNCHQSLVKDIIDVKKLLNEIYNRVENSKSAQPNSKSVHVEEQPFTFNKIVDESSLNAFEEIIQNAEYRSNLIDHLVACIGKNHRDLTHRNMALQVDRKVFDRLFWTTTAWSGGRSTTEGPKKFSLSSHKVFLSFLKDTIQKICGSMISDGDFSF